MFVFFPVFMVEVEGKMCEECLRAGTDMAIYMHSDWQIHLSVHSLGIARGYKSTIPGERLWPNPPRFLNTIADGIRLQQLGELTWPIILELVEKEVFSVVREIYYLFWISSKAINEIFSSSLLKVILFLVWDFLSEIREVIVVWTLWYKIVLPVSLQGNEFFSW